MPKNDATNSGIKLAELMAALSIATDLGMGQPLEYALCGCVFSVRFGEALGLNENELREVYYLSLLRHIGCTAETYKMAEVLGDEIALRSDVAKVDQGNASQIFNLMLRYVRQANQGASPLQLTQTIARGMLTLPKMMQGEFAGFCEVAERLAERLGFNQNVIQALSMAYERWDGRGMPNKFAGENIPLSVRLVYLAQDIVTYHRLEGVDAAVQMAKERQGGAYDPWLVERFCPKAAQLLAGLEEEPSWEMVLDLEPGQATYLSEAEFDNACQVMADFTDLKSPYTIGHSSAVASLAAGAGQRFGLPEAELVKLRRSAQLHDIGRVGISAGIWGKAGPLTEREWEKVRLHPYYTERVLARPAALAKLGTLAAHHHERLDGSGYHRAISASVISPAARLLAAADVYHAMLELRPHRPALTPEAAARQLQNEVRAGRLDREAVNAVLEEAGQSVPGRRPENRAGLSEREIEVLGLIARGQSMKQIADKLVISPKTVDHHIQHIYTKIGVSSRAAAALFAMENNLLPD